MVVALKSLISRSASEGFSFSIHNEALFWSKWVAFTLESVPTLHQFPSGAHRNAILELQLSRGHIGMKYGCLLTLLNIVVTFAEAAIPVSTAYSAPEEERSNYAVDRTLIQVLGQCYCKMFDIASGTPFFDQDDGVSRVSAEYVQRLISVLNHTDLEATRDELLSMSQQFLLYCDKLDKHRRLTFQRIAKSEGYRLETSMVLEKNRALISQYMRQADMPSFVEAMLLDYWALKMSIIQGLGESSVHDWQYYWTFVTRMVRYFKDSQATSRPQMLNEDFDYLYRYMLREADGHQIHLKMRQFMYQFKVVHLDKLEAVGRMKRAQRAHRSSSPCKGPAESVSQLDNMRMSEPEEVDQGDLFWFELDGGYLPCQVILVPQSGAGHDFFILGFDNGDGLLSFSSHELTLAIHNQQLKPRLTSDQCHNLGADIHLGEKKFA